MGNLVHVSRGMWHNQDHLANEPRQNVLVRTKKKKKKNVQATEWVIWMTKFSPVFVVWTDSPDNSLLSAHWSALPSCVSGSRYFKYQICMKHEALSWSLSAHQMQAQPAWIGHLGDVGYICTVIKYAFIWEIMHTSSTFPCPQH